VVVTLSKRNLLSLLHKVDQDWSAATLMRGTNPDDPRVEPLLVVKAETDELHYADPDRQGYGPGRMHPETESFVADPPSLEPVTP
jgi:hypothetical protein